MHEVLSTGEFEDINSIVTVEGELCYGAVYSHSKVLASFFRILPISKSATQSLYFCRREEKKNMYNKFELIFSGVAGGNAIEVAILKQKGNI